MRTAILVTLYKIHYSRLYYIRFKRKIKHKKSTVVVSQEVPLTNEIKKKRM